MERKKERKKERYVFAAGWSAVIRGGKPLVDRPQKMKDEEEEKIS